MEVELHQLEMRYERLRKRHPRAERTLLASLAEIGQQTPVVVVSEAERFVLIDGYKRVRALKRLARDMVFATRWELEEVEALLLDAYSAQSDQRFQAIVNGGDLSAAGSADVDEVTTMRAPKVAAHVFRRNVIGGSAGADAVAAEPLWSGSSLPASRGSP